jgi:hypothetical protein
MLTLPGTLRNPGATIHPIRVCRRARLARRGIPGPSRGDRRTTDAPNRVLPIAPDGCVPSGISLTCVDGNPGVPPAAGA